jgi:transcriptional regulator with XRE-family HTH domain
MRQNGEQRLLRALGHRVRRLRLAKGWTQEILADVCGMRREYIADVERGVRNITVMSLRRIGKGLGVGTALLLRET